MPNIVLPSGFVLDHIYMVVNSETHARAVACQLEMTAMWPVFRHHGQGTSSIAICFTGAYLELIWVTDYAEVRASDRLSGASLAIRADWRNTQASPFGIGLRNDKRGTPFTLAEWTPYASSWLPADASILMLNGTRFEPKWPSIFSVPHTIAYPALLERMNAEQSRNVSQFSLRGSMIAIPKIVEGPILGTLRSSGVVVVQDARPSLQIPQLIKISLFT